MSALRVARDAPPSTAQEHQRGVLSAGDRAFVLDEEASEHDGAAGERLPLVHEPYVVIQKGRSFQRANPHVPALVDRGRFLVVEVEPGTVLVQEPGCFSVQPLRGATLGYSIERTQPSVARPDVEAIVARVAGLRSKVESLAALPTRHSLLPTFTAALEAVEPWLRAAGCEASRVRVPMPDGETANLIGSRAGSSSEPELYVVCAHLDSVNHEGGIDALAPGADDNASGVASVVAMAEALAGVDLEHDVRFVLFGGEEQGLYGSRAFVGSLGTGDRARLRGVVNLDMVASRNTPELSVLIEGSAASRALIDELVRAAATYTSLVTQVSLQPYASDHVPFLEAGIPAVLTIEGTDTAYEHEHTSRDTPDRLDDALHREITKMDLAWLAQKLLPRVDDGGDQ